MAKEIGWVERDGIIPREEAAILAMEVAGLTKLQGHAEKWITVIGAVTGVATVLGFGLNTDGFSDLKSPFNWMVVIVGIAAVIAAATAIFFAGRAATGGEPAGGFQTIPAQRGQVEKISRAGIADLSASHRLTLIAVVLGAVAIGIALLGDENGIADSRWILNSASGTPEAGRVYCGNLAQEQNTGAFLLSVEGADPPASMTQVVQDFTLLTETNACP